MMTSYFRIGGVAIEPPLDFFERVKTFIDAFPEHIDEYENLLTQNPIFVMRTKGVAYLVDRRCAGADAQPVRRLRASGVDVDLRRDASVHGLRELPVQGAGFE